MHLLNHFDCTPMTKVVIFAWIVSLLLQRPYNIRAMVCPTKQIEMKIKSQHTHIISLAHSFTHSPYDHVSDHTPIFQMKSIHYGVAIELERFKFLSNLGTLRSIAFRIQNSHILTIIFTVLRPFAQIAGFEVTTFGMLNIWAAFTQFTVPCTAITERICTASTQITVLTEEHRLLFLFINHNIAVRSCLWLLAARF